MKKHHLKSKFGKRLVNLSSLICAIFMFLVFGSATGSTVIASLAFITMATMPYWSKFIPGFNVGILGNAAITPEKTAEEKAAEILMAKMNEHFKNAGYMTSDEFVKKQDILIDGFISKHGIDKLPDLFKEHVELMKEFKAMQEQVKNRAVGISVLKEVLNKNTDNLKKLKSKEIKSFTVDIELKATQVPGDIADRDFYAQEIPGTVRKPVRRTFIRDLFRKVPVSTEYVKYREENTVTRDAKVVIACATSTHNTKKTWVLRTVQIQKVRDMVDICIDMLEDYDFVESEIRQLVEESVKLKSDAEMFNGTGDILSIDDLASEFAANNVLAPFDGANGFDSPTLAELTAAMKAQIYTFGQENAWNADTILMNYNDWVRFQHAKNSLGDYLLPNFVYTNGGVLNGMRIVTNPLVEPNTLYVFDSTKGKVLDRKMLTVEFSYENKDNFEHETVTVKAVERLQFHVAQIERDAFMKCSDITAALTAITKS